MGFSYSIQMRRMLSPRLAYKNWLIENLVNAYVEHAARNKRRSAESRTYALDNDIGSFTEPCWRASCFIMISIKDRIPAVKHPRRYTKMTTEKATSGVCIRTLLLLQVER